MISEKLSAILNDKIAQFKKNWEPWVNYLIGHLWNQKVLLESKLEVSSLHQTPYFSFFFLPQLHPQASYLKPVNSSI